MDKNFKVFQASAGSGKTYTIIKEYLKRCLKSENDIDNFRNILAITFTNASANDMKAKILQKLKEIISGDKDAASMVSDLTKELAISEEELTKNAQLLQTRIIHDYSSFCVSTIDSFVQKLVRPFARDLGLSSQYTVSIDEKDVSSIVVGNIGLQISDDDPFLVQILNAFIDKQYANEKSTNLENDLGTFVSKLMSEKAYQRDASNDIANEEQYKEAQKFIIDKTTHFEEIVGKFIAQFDKFIAEHHLEAKDFFYGKQGIFSFYNKLRKKTFEPIGGRAQTIIDDTSKWPSKEAQKKFGEAEIEAIAAELATFLPQFGKAYTKALGEYIFYKEQGNKLYLYALRSLVTAEIKALADEEEIVHISEFNKLISSVLGDFSVPFIYERIGERFNHVFIDEFQDTSILQWQNTIPLIDNGLAKNKMSMIVGDGKQSIYRFRGGEVEQIVKLPEIHALPDDERKDAFMQFEKTLVNNFSFKNLEDNYRSLGEIVKFNNDFFKNLIPNLSEASQKVYIEQNETFGKDVKIEQNVKKGDGGMVEIDLYKADSPSDYYLSRIEEIIRTLTQEHGYFYKEIAILTRKTEIGSEIANYLNSKEIPIISNESILLKSSDKVQLIINTLQWLIEDRNIATIATILFYFHITHDTSVTGDVSSYFDEAEAIRHGRNFLENALQLEPYSLKNALNKSTCLYDLCASLIRIYGFDSTKDAFLNYLLNEVHGWQSTDNEGIQEFLDYWEKKKDKLSVQSSGGDAVKIMSIHKSKGLEFNVVIYPNAITDLNETGGFGSPEIWIRPKELGFDAIPHIDKVLFPLSSKCLWEGAKATELYEAERESNRLDNSNLLYVAFTRPKQQLYILAKETKPGNDNSEPKMNVIADYLKQHDDKIHEEASKDGYTVYQFGAPLSFGEREIKASPSISDSKSSDWFKKTKIEKESVLFWNTDEGEMRPNEWGELVHEILSHIETRDDIDKALETYQRNGRIDDGTAKQLKKRFLEIVSNATIQAAFDANASVKNECEILYNKEIIRPDRYAELSDRIYLLDYKTGEKETEHTEQLRNYITALQDMVDKPISAYLIYIGDTVEVEEVVME